MSSFVQETAALHDRVQDGSQAVVFRRWVSAQDLLDHLAVGELDVRAGGVDQQLVGEVAGDLVAIFQQDLAYSSTSSKARPSGVTKPFSTSGPRQTSGPDSSLE